MADEHQQLLERISQIAGKINRRKNEQAGASTLGSSVARPSSIPGSRGYRHESAPYPTRRHVNPRRPPHRHKTLILNGAGRSSEADSATSSESTPTGSWISRNDRHLQLINSSVYEKELQARTKAIEETRKQRAKRRDEHEKQKLMNHISHAGTSVGANGPSVNNYEITVQGIRFAVSPDGRKLIRLPGGNPAAKTPKVATVGGVKFYRTKHGNLYRHAVVKAHMKTVGVRKVNEPCRTFASTGSCAKGPNCRYMHDASKVAVCKDYLLKGECLAGDSCDLSHDLTPERTPACLHFARGNCSNPKCQYTHMTVPPGALVCRAFGLYGYCEKGSGCSERHVFECPDFSNTGHCNIKGCKLPHRERASVLRKTVQRETDDNNEMDDLTSDDDDESVGSNDIDSDEVDEFVGQDESAAVDFEEQKDFIKF